MSEILLAEFKKIAMTAEWVGRNKKPPFRAAF